MLEVVVIYSYKTEEEMNVNALVYVSISTISFEHVTPDTREVLMPTSLQISSNKSAHKD